MAEGRQPSEPREVLEERLREAEETLRAIRQGEVDALVVEGPGGPATYTLKTADVHYRILVEEMGEGAAILGEDAGILYANRSLSELVGVAPERLPGRRLHDFLVEAHVVDLDHLLDRRGGRTEVRLVGADGPVSVALSVSPMRVEELDGFCVVVTDLSDHLRLARAEQERAAAEAASRAKDQFLSILGHELRNPLGAILNALEILKSEPDEATETSMRRIIERQATHVGELVDDLLDVSRIESGKLHVQREARAIAPLVRSVVDAKLLEADALGIRLLLQVPEAQLHAAVDPTRLRQVVHNLVANAIRAVGEGGTVEVVVGSEGSDVIVRVRDDGRGIAAEDLGRIFEPFVQGQQEGLRGGLGLGLTLARRLAELQGGALSVTSAGLGHGAEFELRLPTCASPAVRSRPRRGRSPIQPLRMLVVDDDTDCADSLAILLGRDGHQVAVAYSAADALQKVEAGRFDAVVSDLGLPGMDGYQLGRELRERAAQSALIAVSGFVDDDALRRSREVGFVAHLAKPLDLRRLRRTLQELARPSSDEGDTPR